MNISASPALFRIIDLPDDLSLHTPADRVIKAAFLDARNRRQNDVRNAMATATQIVDRAHAQADASIQAAIVEAEQIRSARLRDIEEEVAAQLTLVAEHLGDAVAASVESIYRSIFRSDPGLLIKATVEIARDALREQLGSILQTSIADRDDVAIEALSDRYAIQSNHELPSGVLRIRSENGDLRIDASKLIEDLGHDLRLWFRQAGQTGLS